MSELIEGIGVAVNTNGFGGDLTRFDEYLTFVEDTGADHAEFGAHGLDIIVDARLLEGRVREVEEICAAHDLRYTLHAPTGLNFMDDRYPELQREVALALIELGDRIGAEVLVVHAGRAPGAAGDTAPSPALRRMERDGLRDLAGSAAGAGVRIAVENLNAMALAGGLVSTGLDLEVLGTEMAEIDHPGVGIALDLSHALSASEHLAKDYLATIEAAAPYVSHLHLNDSAGRPMYDAFPNRYQDRLVFGIDDLHLPVGWGRIDYDRVLERLEPRRPILVTLEIDHRFDHEIGASVERARELAAAMNERAVAR
jgi:sugar phosphate isomerase/epimerase